MSTNVELRLEEVPCNFCGSRDYGIWWRFGDWTVAECHRCRFRYTNPRPAKVSLASFYTEAYFREQGLRLTEAVRHHGGRDLFAHQKFRCYSSSPNPTPTDSPRTVDIEPWFHERGSLLEVGAATGEFLNVMQNRGWTVRGIDISRDAVAFGRRVYGVNLVAATPEEFDTPERFDVVCMYQTLEHLPDPLHVLRKAQTWLRPGGILVIEVPNADSFDIRISRHRARLTLDLPRHLSHFTPRFLCGQLERLAFNVVNCSLYPPAPLVTLLRWRALLGTRIGRPKGPPSGSMPLAARPTLPLAHLPAETWKSRLLQLITSVAPGWRFTVVARTAPPPG